MTDVDVPAGGLILGIDLGTTNSAAAVWDPDAEKVVALPSAEGRRLTPSAVGWDADAQAWMVGDAAVELARRNPEAVAQSIKRYIGRWFTDPRVRSARDHIACRLVSGGGGDQLRDVVVELGSAADGSPIRLSAPEVSAKVLAKVREDAAAALGLPLEAVSRAVITVPAYFNVLQRRATRLAGELAGLEVVDLLNEPTAAALASAQDVLTPEPRRILVYDLGGGTFDIALLEALRDADGYVFDTEVVHGDASLGGDDIDAAVARWLSNGTVTEELRVAAERAKVQLSAPDVDAVEVSLDLRGDRAGGPPLILTREQLERSAADVLDRARAITREAVEDIAQLGWQDIADVILVGGQTLMPAVRRQLVELGARKAHLADEPQLAVALGAGEYGHMLSLGRSRFPERTLVNVLAMPLGIRLDENTFKHVVEANKTVPHRSAAIPVTTTYDNQPLIEVEVLQGPRRATRADECVLLGSLEMDVPPLPARSPKFEVVFDVHADGTLQVIVRDATRERTQALDITESRRILAWKDDRNMRK